MPNPYTPGSQEGLPAHARGRLAAMKPRRGPEGPMFTSDLSVNEFLLVKEAGFDPLGLVVGSSIYHIGWQKPAMNQSMELETLTQAMYHARELAMTRMEEEADSIGADGIVGVRLEVGRQEWGENLAEFIAIGTAIKARNGESHRAPNGRPFTSDLSGQDFWTLIKSGYRPVSFVMGNCVYHVGYQGVKAWFSQIGQNVEMPTYTQAIYDARELVPGPDAGRSRAVAGGRHRRRDHQGELARLGQPRHRVFRRRHQHHRHPRRPHHPHPVARPAALGPLTKPKEKGGHVTGLPFTLPRCVLHDCFLPLSAVLRLLRGVPDAHDRRAAGGIAAP